LMPIPVWLSGCMMPRVMHVDGRDQVASEVLEQHWEQLAVHQMDDFRASSLHRLVESLLRGTNVLDVGCGTGGFVVHLAQRGYDVHGIDSSERMVRNARAALGAAGLSQDLVSCGRLDEGSACYDTVVSLDVIEHNADDLGLVREMARRLRPGGRLILTVPAMPSLYGPRDIALGHFRRYDKTALRRLCQKADLDLLQMRSWNMLGVAPTLLAKLLRKRLSEELRYGDSHIAVTSRWVLRTWLTTVENRVPMPLGLTLVMVCSRQHESV
jgi:2-polyprenyl-3-methyl-5-hydroxy-6-metoxy-1,4-benzoquinol methylase